MDSRHWIYRICPLCDYIVKNLLGRSCRSYHITIAFLCLSFSGAYVCRLDLDSVKRQQTFRYKLESWSLLQAITTTRKDSIDFPPSIIFAGRRSNSSRWLPLPRVKNCWMWVAEPVWLLRLLL